jgi:hypothetical protein
MKADNARLVSGPAETWALVTRFGLSRTGPAAS